MAKILLVEDDKSLREIYGVRLQAEGYTIISAGDGEEALAVAIKERPDLIVSDVMMPKISGFDMLDILRSTTETKDIKVIMMTALSSEDQRARGEALGADRYLVKSQVGIEDVVRTVHDVLGDSVGAAAPVTQPAPAVEPVAAPVVEQPLAPQFIATPPAPVVVETLYTPPVASVEPVMPTQPVASAVPAPQEQAVPTYQEPTAQPAPAPFTMPEPSPAPLEAPTAVSAPFTAPVAIPEPVVMPQPIEMPQPVEMPPMPAPEPILAPLPAAPAPIPFPAPQFPAPQPLQAPAPSSVGLPQPTAPFSSNPPASLGDRIINPLPSAEGLGSNGITDIASQMNQELNAHLQGLDQPSAAAPTAAAPTLSPEPAPQVTQFAAPPQPPIPALPPLPPQPGQ